jgi:hypothetical protein
MVAKNDIVRASQSAAIDSSRASRRAYDRVWSLAARAPVFCRVSKKKTPEGKTRRVFRTKRLVSAHAYNVAASGAALHAARVVQGECATLRLDAASESARAPWLPTVSSGARLVLEQFLAALAQEAAYKAHAVREGAGSAKRLNGSHMRIAWDAVFESVFCGASALPRSVAALPLVQKPRPAAAGKKGAGKSHEQDGDAEYDDEAGEADAEGNIDDLCVQPE